MLMMRKYFLGMMVWAFFLVVGNVFAVDPVDTFKWAYDRGILSLHSWVLWSSVLKRQEVAPILLKYILEVSKKDYTDRGCKASDIYQADTLYQNDLKTLCGFGIFIGEKNKLLPKQYLSNAQAITLVMRVVDGYQKEASWGEHRAAPYFKRAKELWYEWITPLYYKKNLPMTLENFINFLYSVEHPHQSVTQTEMSADTSNQKSSFKSSDDALLKLAEIMSS